jgi:hypothetical protein
MYQQIMLCVLDSHLRNQYNSIGQIIATSNDTETATEGNDTFHITRAGRYIHEYKGLFSEHNTWALTESQSPCWGPDHTREMHLQRNINNLIEALRGEDKPKLTNTRNIICQHTQLLSKALVYMSQAPKPCSIPW